MGHKTLFRGTTPWKDAEMALTQVQRTALAEGSLAGLSVGDAFGDQFFLLANRHLSVRTDSPPAPWPWSDDTEMACSVLDVLNKSGRITQCGTLQ